MGIVREKVRRGFRGHLISRIRGMGRVGSERGESLGGVMREDMILCVCTMY